MPSEPRTAPSAKIRAFVRPRLLQSPIARGGRSPEALWQLGEQAETAYDFAAARDLYLCAAHAAGSAQSLDFTSRYAEFLVDRFGQFEEVAAWLDDPGFVPPAADGTAQARPLLRRLARAAVEAQHTRAAELDAELCRVGDPEALERTARRHLDAGHREAAVALLAAHGERLDPLTPAGKLWAQLRAVEQQRAAAEARQRRLEAEQVAADLRRQIEAALDAGDLKGALPIAKRLAAEASATPADRNWVPWIEAELAKQQRQALVAAIEAEAGDAADAMLALLQAQGASAWRPAPSHPLAETWQRAIEVHEAAPELPRAEQRRAIQVLGCIAAAVERAEHTWAEGSATSALDRAKHDLGAALHELPAPCAALRVPVKARALLARLHAAIAEAHEKALDLAVAAALDRGDVTGATALCEEHARQQPQASATVKRLRREIHDAARNREQQAQRQAELDQALADGDVLTARAKLRDLRHVLPPDARAAAEARLEPLAATLRARPTPPGLQKLQPQAVVCNVAFGRLIVVQDGLWLAVNLASGGLQPYALPADWPVEVPLARLGVCGERIRLVGLSRGRLVTVDQVPGSPPEVTAAVGLAAIGATDLLGAAVEPDAAVLGLLHRSPQRPGTTWTRLDADTLAVLDQRRTAVPWQGACGVAGTQGVLAALAMKPGRGDQDLVWECDERGEPVLRLSLEAVGEPVAGFRAACAWPQESRVYAAFDQLDPFDPGAVHREPSLLVLRNGKVSFASSDLRRRFAPSARVVVDHPWTLDPASGRLWYTLLPTEGAAPRTALLLGVDARTLRPDRPVELAGVERVLALAAVPDGAVALGALHGGGYGLTRARVADGELALTTQKLPL